MKVVRIYFKNNSFSDYFYLSIKDVVIIQDKLDSDENLSTYANPYQSLQTY